MNYRQPSVVETIIWLVAAVIAAFVAIGVTLLMAMVGAAMLVVRMASEAARSVFENLFGGRTIHNQRSREQGVRPTIVEGQVIRRNG
ncbi:hypothetical protein C5Y97_25150 [Blastopirellula marina]|uniref:Uncharacterized protein n=1 Tax=Blastopirellula marina TaxID=124 RepID=A0A2S8F7Q2_9BACT|nr:hypothetical protein C5Y98_25135 [Blastopirellula marina]PTL41729.1 hypothetical protein C5Y97_25150 [Blastopirellula marina]